MPFVPRSSERTVVFRASTAVTARQPATPRPCLQRSSRPSGRSVPRRNVCGSSTARFACNTLSRGASSSSGHDGAGSGPFIGQWIVLDVILSPGVWSVIFQEYAKERLLRIVHSTGNRIVHAGHAVDAIQRSEKALRTHALRVGVWFLVG